MKQFFQTKYHSFSQLSTHQKAKRYIIAAYIIIALTTIAFVIPRSNNELGAKLFISNDMLIGPYIIVENSSEKPWTAVRYLLNGGYTIRGRKYKRLSPKSRISLPIDRFRRKKFSRRHKRRIWVKPKQNLQLESLRISSKQGTVQFDLNSIHSQQTEPANQSKSSQ